MSGRESSTILCRRRNLANPARPLRAQMNSGTNREHCVLDLATTTGVMKGMKWYCPISWQSASNSGDTQSCRTEVPTPSIATNTVSSTARVSACYPVFPSSTCSILLEHWKDTLRFSSCHRSPNLVIVSGSMHPSSEHCLPPSASAIGLLVLTRTTDFV